MEEALDSDAIVDNGWAHHQAGRLQEAESLYQKALAVDPAHPGALYYLANIAYEDSRLQFAMELIETLLRDEPNDAEAWHLLGMVALKEEDFPRAVECLNKALIIQPSYAQAHYGLGVALSRQGELDTAFESFQRAATLNPAFAEAHCSIGNIFRAQKKFDEALSSYRQAVEAKRDFTLAYENIGEILLSQKKLDEAITNYRKAITEIPNNAMLHAALGNIQLLKNENVDAAASFERAIALDPNCAIAHSNLGTTLMYNEGRFSEAVAHLQRAVSLSPEQPRMWANLSRAYHKVGKTTDEVDCLQKACALDSDNEEYQGRLLFSLQLLPNYPREKIFADHVAFGERFETPLRNSWPSHSTAVDPKKRLRVGLVSRDLHSHPVGYFLESILRELHHRDGIDIIVYSSAEKEDAVTQRLRASTREWSLVTALSDDALAQRINGDNIDILVDLSGHTVSNRLLVFARKPAPVQVSWLGYWETTGLRAIDYILCDEYGVHADEAKFYVEEPWFLPNTRLCFTLPTESISVAPLPALSTGHITFGCFNNASKINDSVVEVWSRILKRIPTSRLFLKWGTFFDPAVREDVVARFAAQGITSDRLHIESVSPRSEYLAAYNRVDIALDPFPFPGGTTTVEGIWMGVPVITKRGDRIISRQGEGILHNIGLQDWIADNEDSYVELAVRHATDLSSLAKLRGELRQKLESSPLCDAKLFAQNLENAFKQMWEKHASPSQKTASLEQFPTSFIEVPLPEEPKDAEGYYARGDSLSKSGKPDAALKSFQQAVTLNPEFAEAYCSIADILRTQNKFESALSNYQQAIDIKSDFELAYENMGRLLLAQGKLDEAATVYRKAVAAIPDSALLHIGLSTAYFYKNETAAAIASFERVIELDPNCIVAYGSLGVLLIRQGKFSEAVTQLERAVVLDPQNPSLFASLSNAYDRAGRLTDALDSLRRAIALDPNFVGAHSDILLLSQYLSDYPREKAFADHVAFGEQFETPLRINWPSHAKPVSTEKRLRVGFVSGDLRNHPVGYFLESVFRQLRQLDELDIVVYSTGATADALTERLRTSAREWLVVSELSDDAFAQRISGDNIDILVDLSGHTVLNRLLVFARKPAPIQVTWLGYWETTGLRAIDYIFCDRYSVREDEAKFYTEEPWFLPNTRLCFTLPTEPVSITSPPALKSRHVTFGCFNNLVKITDRVIEVWSRILKRVPNARLLLKWQSLSDVNTRENILARFAAQGIAEDRLLMEPASPRHAYLTAYNRVDIALDPFPFSGGATTVDGIWMGVPLVTMRGDRIISRQGEGILHNLGLQDWIAGDEDDYVELAVRRAQDLPGLSNLRGQLRARLEFSPLADAKLFARNLQDAFKQMWTKYCEASAEKREAVPPINISQLQPQPQQTIQVDADELTSLVVGAALGNGLPAGQPINFSARRSKPIIVIAAAPKSGSTFLSNVITRITGLPYRRLSSGYSTNEHDLYLPSLYIMNNSGCVSQLHMKGTFHNAALLKAFGIKPVIQVRNIEDTIISLADDLRTKEKRDNFGSGQVGFSFLWQDHAIANLNDTALIDCIIDLAIPWYVNFYVSWYRLCARNDVDALWLTYEDMMKDKRTSVNNILEFTGFGKGIHFDDAILDQRYSKFNKGQSGRGSTILSEAQKARVRRLFSYYPDVDFSRYGLSR
jgi:protein O-GlcNAc transferase